MVASTTTAPEISTRLPSKWAKLFEATTSSVVAAIAEVAKNKLKRANPILFCENLFLFMVEFFFVVDRRILFQW